MLCNDMLQQVNYLKYTNNIPLLNSASCNSSQITGLFSTFWEYHQHRLNWEKVS